MTRFVFKVFMAFCVCSVALFAAKAPENKCYFPPYEKERPYCILSDTSEPDSKEGIAYEKQCKAKASESGHSEWVDTLLGLIDGVEMQVYGSFDENDETDSDKKAKDEIKSIDIIFSSYLPPALSFDAHIVDFNASDEGIIEEIREATECKGKSCTTKGYDDEGKLIFEANCISGINHGKQRLYDYYGNLKMELNYNKGKLEGRQNLGAKPDENSDINIVEIKNGKLSGKIKLDGSISHDIAGYGGSYYSISGEFKNGKPISVIHIGDGWSSGVHASESYNTYIPFDENSVLNGDYIKHSLEQPHELFNNNMKYSYQNGELTSFEYMDMGSIKDYISEYDELSQIDVYEVATPSDFEKVKEINIFTSKNVVDMYKENYAKINNDDTDRYVSPYYKSGNFNAKGKKTGKWIEKNLIRFNDYEIITTQTLESNYENDKLNGAQKEWLNGKLIKETMYENDMLNGTLKEWDNNGNLIKAEIYKNGNRVQIIR